LFNIFGFSPATFSLQYVCSFERSARGLAQPSSRINQPPINPPTPIEELAEDLRQLDFSNAAQAQVAATSSGDSWNDWLLLRVPKAPPGLGRGVSASSNSGLARTIAQPTSAHRPRRMINDPNSWWNGETLPAFGDLMCYWAGKTCRNPEPLATKACHFNTLHQPRFIYACSLCATVTHQSKFDEVLDLRC